MMSLKTQDDSNDDIDSFTPSNDDEIHTDDSGISVHSMSGSMNDMEELHANIDSDFSEMSNNEK